MRKYTLGLFVSACVLALAQAALTNEGIVKLVKSGMSEDLVINLISRQQTSFTLGADDLVALKTAGVTEKIIAAMVNRSGPVGAATATPSAPAKPTIADAPSTSVATLKEGYLYYKKNNEYLEMLTEEVNWSTKGALKNVASVGFLKKNLKGNVNGPSSRNFVNIPFEMIIAPQKGMSVNDYVLLPLRVGKGERNFEVGPVNKKIGVAEGAIPFGVERVGTNAYRMVFQSPLGPGEYGILTAGSMGGTEFTRMFSFRLLI